MTIFYAKLSVLRVGICGKNLTNMRITKRPTRCVHYHMCFPNTLTDSLKPVDVQGDPKSEQRHKSTHKIRRIYFTTCEQPTLRNKCTQIYNTSPTNHKTLICARHQMCSTFFGLFIVLTWAHYMSQNIRTQLTMSEPVSFQHYLTNVGESIIQARLITRSLLSLTIYAFNPRGIPNSLFYSQCPLLTIENQVVCSHRMVVVKGLKVN